MAWEQQILSEALGPRWSFEVTGVFMGKWNYKDGTAVLQCNRSDMNTLIIIKNSFKKLC